MDEDVTVRIPVVRLFPDAGERPALKTKPRLPEPGRDDLERRRRGDEPTRKVTRG